jgi:hypothetical protein
LAGAKAGLLLFIVHGPRTRLSDDSQGNPLLRAHRPGK